MAKLRLIPKLQIRANSTGKNLVLVITKQFDKVIEIGNPISMAKIYQAQGADELIFTNIRPDLTNFSELSKMLESITEEIFMPITVGGGINNLSQIRQLLMSGADKICINTSAVLESNLIQSASNTFGNQCIVVSIDYKVFPNGESFVYINSGKEKTLMNPVEWAKKAEKLGAGEILLTSIDNDGMRSGMNNTINKLVSEAVSIPVIVSGGCSLPQHFIDAVKIGNADAVAAGTFFAFKDQSFMQIRSHLKNAGINVRVYT